MTSRWGQVTGTGLTCLGLNFCPESSKSMSLQLPAGLVQFVFSYSLSRAMSRWVSRSAAITAPLTWRRQVSGGRCLSARHRQKCSKVTFLTEFNAGLLLWGSVLLPGRRFERVLTGRIKRQLGPEGQTKIWRRERGNWRQNRWKATERVTRQIGHTWSPMIHCATG